ncbi:MAG: hypothetical protein JSW58_17525 [Candidatus Latescibacterota bacterium]|nr:MAG: hypothetical protein JSW58_17525 [Candidatus Latescibacterota bacterium]
MIIQKAESFFRCLTLILIAALIYACSASIRVFTHPEADMSYYTKVGVVPFQNLSSDRLAGEKFSTEFTTALLAANKFEVVEQGIFVNAVVRTVGSRTVPDGLTADQLKKVAEATGVQGVFEGVVTQYNMSSSGGESLPVIGVEARLVDTETGTIVWKATISERGGPKTPIIGVGEIHTLGELSQKLSKVLVSRIN